MIKSSPLILMLLMISSTLTHAQCFEPSPNLMTLGDNYYRQMQRHQWSNLESKQKDELQEETEGRWEGEYSEIECLGTEKNPREKQKSANLKVEFQNAMKGILKMSAWKSFTSEKKTTSDVVMMFDDHHIFAGSVSKSSIEATEIHSARLGGGGHRMDEIVTKLELNGDQLRLIRKIYFNGYLGRVERYTLKRD